MARMLDVMESPYKNAPESPSRQLLWELSRLQITSQEAFYARLDRENGEREAAHRYALSAAAAEHDRIRRGAEIECEKLQLQIQAERERREREERQALEKERLALERQRREKAEREVEERRREIEKAQMTEAAEKRAAEARKAADAAKEEARLAKEKRDAEATSKAVEKAEMDRLTADKEREAKEKAEEALKKRTEPTSSPDLVQISQPLSRSSPPYPEREAEYQRYLEIHRKLKELRKFLTDQAKQDTSLRTQVGDMRRSIRKCVGQLTEGKNTNRAPVNLSFYSSSSSFL